jgi:hypothetical protein
MKNIVNAIKEKKAVVWVGLLVTGPARVALSSISAYHRLTEHHIRGE